MQFYQLIIILIIVFAIFKLLGRHEEAAEEKEPEQVPQQYADDYNMIMLELVHCDKQEKLDRWLYETFKWYGKYDKEVEKERLEEDFNSLLGQWSEKLNEFKQLRKTNVQAEM